MVSPSPRKFLLFSFCFHTLPIVCVCETPAARKKKKKHGHQEYVKQERAKYLKQAKFSQSVAQHAHLYTRGRGEQKKTPFARHSLRCKNFRHRGVPCSLLKPRRQNHQHHQHHHTAADAKGYLPLPPCTLIPTTAMHFDPSMPENKKHTHTRKEGVDRRLIEAKLR